MKDYLMSLERLRRDAAEAKLVRDLATDDAKKTIYDHLAQHFERLADEVEAAINANRNSSNGSS